MLISQIGIQIYYKISIPRKSTKVHIFNLGLTNLERGKNSSKSHIGFHAYLSNGYLNLMSKFNYERVDKSAYFQPCFDQPWRWAKIGSHGCLSNGYLDQLSKLNSEKFDKRASFQPLFDHPWMRAKIAPNIIKNRRPCLFLKWVPKSTFKTQFRENP